MSLRALPRRAGSWARRYGHRFLFHNEAYLRDELLVSSYFVPQPTLGFIRVGIFVYCLAVLVTNLAVNIVHDAGWSWAAYFTTLTFFGITLYYGFAAYNTLRHTMRQRQRQQMWWWQSAGMRRGGKRKISEMPISQPMPLTSEQREKLAYDSRFEVPSSRDASTPSLAAGSGYASGIEHVHLLRAGSQQQRPTALRDIDEITEMQRQPSPDGSSGVVQKDTIEEAQAETANTSSATVVAGRAACQSLATRHQLSLASQWLLYESFTCYAPLVTLIYWCLLYPTQGGFDGALDTWMGVSMHACNSVLMVLEVGVFARTRYRWTHVGAMVFILVLYLALVYFMVGVYDFYVYPFFETRYFGGYVAVVCFLIVDVICIIWVVMLLVHRARDAVYQKWLSRRQTPTFAF
ncbi:hypothetical protein GGI15_003422 [Coemansia interrupta]|uniref:Transmembrane protein n=1 Tax=Coemansia interrupta TaxID=1126814 RepID=A0A9W8H7G9_9FUNG|nr:hypothetical protein GGI15_003422 [Coemansia interrupta]